MKTLNKESEPPTLSSTMMMPELPQELLEEILRRVPATSLKRLRTTCKEWNRLFNDKNFSRKQFDKAAKQCLALTLTEESRACLLNVNLHDGTPSAELTCELSLIDSHSNSNQVKISRVSHCDGLLLCTIKNEARIVVWNPCTGQTKWIQTSRNSCNKKFYDFVLGYSQDNKSCNKSYKILSYTMYWWRDQDFKIYDVNSNSWMNIDVTPIPDYRMAFCYYHVSLKGKTYWFAFYEKEKQLGLISFDYTKKRFERLRLPYQCDSYKNLSLSVVGEEKLSVLLQLENTSREEIWVTNKIDNETKELSWSKLLEVSDKKVDRRDSWVGSFLVDEEKKIVVCCEHSYRKIQSVITVYTVGEDSNATRRSFPVKTMSSHRPCLVVDYVPSLIQF